MIVEADESRRHLHQDPDADRRRHQHRSGASSTTSRPSRTCTAEFEIVLSQHPFYGLGRRLHRPSRGRPA
jgi:hypothetical protein